MTVLRRIAVLGTVSLPAMVLAACGGGDGDGTASASCPRGTLDNAYCDNDGDLLADTPDGAGQWLDPDTIVFSYTPVEDPAVYAGVWDGFIRHMEEVTGRQVDFFPVQSNGVQYEAMRAGRLHVAGINTGGTPVAVNCSGFVPFAMMAADDGSYGYEMEIITHPDSGIESPTDLAGSTLAFTSPTSNSGFKAPSAILRSEFGLIADEDYETAFSGKHDNSVLGVVNRDYPAAAIANSVMLRMIDREVIGVEDVTVVYRSATFPTTAYGHAHNLAPALAVKVREAFFTFDWAGTELETEFQDEDQFIAIEYARDWEIIRTIDAANGISYDCR